MGFGSKHWVDLLKCTIDLRGFTRWKSPVECHKKSPLSGGVIFLYRYEIRLMGCLGGGTLLFRCGNPDGVGMVHLGKGGIVQEIR